MDTKTENLLSAWNIDVSRPVGLIFDIDELLFDNSHDLFLAYRSLLESRGLTIKDGETFPGKNLFEIVAGIKARYDISEDEETLIKERRAKYIELLSQTEAPIQKGAKEILTFIDQNRGRLNIRAGYATSSERTFIEIILKKLFLLCGLPQYASAPDTFFYQNSAGEHAVTCWEPGLEKKPSPAVYLKTLEKIGLPAQQCIAFEDSMSGFKAAVAAGLSVVVVPSPSNVRGFKDMGTGHRFCKMSSLKEFLPVLSSIVA